MKDEAKFLEWWTKVYPSARRSIVSIVGSESFDIMQDISLMAIQRFDDFQNYDAFRRWCFIRARWLALDQISRRGLLIGDSEYVEAEPASVPDPRIEELRKMILNLPAQQKKVTFDRIQGYTSEEIATRLSIAPSTVRSIWRNAKQKLVEMMQND